MESSVSSLREMNERINTWMQEKPQWSDSGLELRMQEGDLVIFQFVANGDEGDRFIKVYRSHIISQERQSKDGSRFTSNDARYCPIRSGEAGLECPLCTQGLTANIKERMSMWLYVHNILHKNMPQEKQFPAVQYEGSVYFNEEVNNFKIWHTSAWRESPWTDILKNAEIYKGLHNFTGNLLCVGQKFSRRYKFYAIPNSPMLPPEVYEKAKTECEPVLDILHRQVSGVVQAAPPAEAVPPLSSFQPITNNVSTMNVQPFNAPGATVPTLSVPALEISGSAPAPPLDEPETPPPTPEAQSPTESQPEPVAEPEKRPLQRLF